MTSQAELEKLSELEQTNTLASDELATLEAQLERIMARKGTLTNVLHENSKALKSQRARVEQAQQVEADLKAASNVSAAQQEWADWFQGLCDDKFYADKAKHYQWDGAMFLAAAKRGILGDMMGLGKSLTSLMALDMTESKKVIIIAQAEICEQFAGEVMEWAPHRRVFNLAKKTQAKRTEIFDDLETLDEWVVVINFEILRTRNRDVEPLEQLILLQTDSVIVDEAHNLKDVTSSAFKNVSTLVYASNTCPSCGYLQLDDTVACAACGWIKSQPTNAVYDTPLDMMLSVCSVKNLILTTGTPILNDPGDLFPLLHLCNPIHFPKLSNFYTKYCINNYFSGKWEFKQGGLEALKPLIAGNYIARTVEDAGIELPTQHVHVVPITLDAEQYPKQHKAVTQLSEAAAMILDDGQTMNVLDTMALITRKRQANVWPGGIVMKDKETDAILFDAGEIDESVKLDRAAMEILRIHAAGRRQVVFSQFKTGLAAFERRLRDAGLSVARFDGDTPAGDRSAIKSNFNLSKGETPKWDVLLANYRSGGTGLNLTAATATHIIDEEWNPGKRDQAYKRTDRIGQVAENDVYVYRIEKSIDSWMANTIARKEQIVEGFNEANATVSAQTLKEAMESGEVI